MTAEVSLPSLPLPSSLKKEVEDILEEEEEDIDEEEEVGEKTLLSSSPSPQSESENESSSTEESTTNSPSSVPSGSAAKPTPPSVTPHVAPFLEKLSAILAVEDPKIICWSDDGKSFEIHNLKLFTDVILAKYFRHNRFASFQRQLNYFGFKKMSKFMSNICTYSRQHFSRDRPEDIKLIKRNKKSSSQKAQQQKNYNLLLSTAMARSVGVKRPFDALDIHSAYQQYPNQLMRLGDAANLYLAQTAMANNPYASYTAIPTPHEYPSLSPAAHHQQLEHQHQQHHPHHQAGENGHASVSSSMAGENNGAHGAAGGAGVYRHSPQEPLFDSATIDIAWDTIFPAAAQLVGLPMGGGEAAGESQEQSHHHDVEPHSFSLSSSPAAVSTALPPVSTPSPMHFNDFHTAPSPFHMGGGAGAAAAGGVSSSVETVGTGSLFSSGCGANDPKPFVGAFPVGGYATGGFMGFGGGVFRGPNELKIKH